MLYSRASIIMVLVVPMARVTSWPGHRAKTEEEFSREQNGRPEIEPHAKTEEGTE
mgnify:CR=1 FL=1